jgi:hypothetical protein
LRASLLHRPRIELHHLDAISAEPSNERPVIVPGRSGSRLRSSS